MPKSTLAVNKMATPALYLALRQQLSFIDSLCVGYSTRAEIQRRCIIAQRVAHELSVRGGGTQGLLLGPDMGRTPAGGLDRS